MYILWMCLCIISTVLVYLYIPETKCLPIEEIGALFGDEVIVHLTSDGHGIVEAEKEFAVTGDHAVVHDIPKNVGTELSHEVKA
jgi:hypothetical protein